jgi:hypothetical protein
MTCLWQVSLPFLFLAAQTKNVDAFVYQLEIMLENNDVYGRFWKLNYS